MEIRDLFLLLKRNLKFFLAGSILGLVISASLFYFLPLNFIAEGTLYAYPVGDEKQDSEVSNELNYARNLIAISNSPEYKKIISDRNLAETSFVPLIGMTSSIRLKEISPNILSLSVSGTSSQEALLKYQAYFSELNEFSKLLNKGNSRFDLVTLKDSPIINSNSKNLFLFLVLGFICGNFGVIIYFYHRKR
jgi:hypothetical protein